MDTFILTVSKIHWLENVSPEQDLCAHGSVTVQIGPEVLDDGTQDDWCVSAAALHLLRTLTSDHWADQQVAEHLVPHCGHAMYEVPGTEDLVVVGCMHGLNWSVVHQGESVALSTIKGTIVDVPFQHWKQAVLNFADAVEVFYQVSEPKQQPDDADDAAGYKRFWSEWNRRRTEAGLAPRP